MKYSLHAEIIFLALFLLAAVPNYIPALRLAEIATAVALLLLAAISGLGYGINLCVQKCKKRSTATTDNWPTVIAKSIGIVVPVCLAAYLYYVSTVSGLIFGPQLNGTYELKEKTIYVYWNDPWPSNDRCPPSYGSEIYLKSNYFPLMYHVSSVDYYVGGIRPDESGCYLIKDEERCGHRFVKTGHVAL